MQVATKVGLGLFAAWALHDAEEIATMAATSRDLVRQAPAWWPVPEDIRRDGLSQRHVTTGVGIMAAVVGAAALDGVRSGGRSRFFQWSLQAFGWHSVGHLAATALTRRYTTGVATAPVVVIPYWLWARRTLARDGVELRPVGVRSLAPLYPLLLGVHVVSRIATRARVRSTGAQAPTDCR